MNQSNEQLLRQFIEAQTGISLKNNSADDDLFVVLALDSLDALALLAKIEKKFNFLIPNDQLADTRTINAVLKLMK